ncbi:hypothetical protein ACH5RR_018490 [Cinchona calisaya]|uniref:Uncharacterized protein n=1 Tax=Cinchona calisaya TaxID=153742 RepID=A0ABD2ZLK8_9GENT
MELVTDTDVKCHNSLEEIGVILEAYANRDILNWRIGLKTWPFPSIMSAELSMQALDCMVLLSLHFKKKKSEAETIHREFFLSYQGRRYPIASRTSMLLIHHSRVVFSFRFGHICAFGVRLLNSQV